jgi:hypothetical protein
MLGFPQLLMFLGKLINKQINNFMPFFFNGSCCMSHKFHTKAVKYVQLYKQADKKILDLVSENTLFSL